MQPTPAAFPNDNGSPSLFFPFEYQRGQAVMISRSSVSRAARGARQLRSIKNTPAACRNFRISASEAPLDSDLLSKTLDSTDPAGMFKPRKDSEAEY